MPKGQQKTRSKGRGGKTKTNAAQKQVEEGSQEKAPAKKAPKAISKKKEVPKQTKPAAKNDEQKQLQIVKVSFDLK